MPLVYLDTSHLSALAKALAGGDASFADFHKAWKRLGAELAFTRTHLVELRQHGSATVRAERYALLEQLLPIHSDVVTREPTPDRPVLLQAREALRAFYRLKLFGIRSEDTRLSDEWVRQHLEVFPERWESPSDVQAARTFESPEFGNIVLYMQDAMRLQAEAETRPRSIAYDRMKLRDLKDAPISAADTKTALETFERIISSDAEVAALFPHLPIDMARDMLSSQMEPLRRMILRAGEVGIRRAYLEAMGLEADPGDKRFLDDISNDLLFQHHVQSAVEILGATTAESNALRARISSRDCPGFWLARSVWLDIRKAEPEPDPSNAYDLDHVMYAPYVDLFFTDKRIAGYINAARKRRDSITAIAQMPEAIAIPSSVEALTTALRAAAGGGG